MNITRHNCEARFLDYYEKNLSPVEVAEVLFFLEENPDMKEVFESYEAIYLEHEKINFPSKESLKKKYTNEELDRILSSGINRTNCEQFFIANAEGILLSLQKEKLNLFLLQYPELKKEAELFQQCKLSAEKVSFEGKETLKKQLITKENREEYFVRSIENDLNAFEQKELNLFLARNPEYKNELKLFLNAILPIEKIYFEDKESLKRKERKPVFVSIFSQRSMYYAAAASVLLLVGLFFFFRNNDNNAVYVADTAHPAKNKIVNEKPVKENNTTTGKEENIIPKTNASAKSGIQMKYKEQTAVKKNEPVSHSESKEEKIEFQPILSQDAVEEKLTAQKEEPQLPLMKEEAISAQVKLPEEKTNTKEGSTGVSVKNVKNSSDDYQSVSAFVTKKVRSLLGVKNANPCTDPDKLGWWDLAMAAKNQVQKITGTKALDVNKVCDGTGNKVEYVFAAGNFEFSRSAAK